MIDIREQRAITPGCELAIHMNNAGASLPPAQVVEAMLEYLRYEALHGGYEVHAERIEQVNEFYTNAGRLLGCKPGNIAFHVNATEAYGKALSAVRFEKGDVILTSKNDYTSNQIQFLSLAKRFGIRPIHVPDLPGGGIDPQAVKEYITKYAPRLVSVSHVPTNSGLVQDVVSVGAVCAQTGVIYIVDACQSVGQMEVDVTEIGCHFLSGTMRKFLRGPRGGGFLYVSDHALEMGLEPLMIDMRGADLTGPESYEPKPDATRFEGWENNFGVVRGAAVAIQHALSVGLTNIRLRNEVLAGYLREGLAAIDGIRLLDAGSQLCSIVTLYFEGATWQGLKEHLSSRQIHSSVALSHNNPIDFGPAAKDVPWALRLSPHYYNTVEEISAVIEVLRNYRP